MHRTTVPTGRSRSTKLLGVVLSTLLIACGGDEATNPDGVDPVTTASCENVQSITECVDDTCETRSCRGDEVCENEACVEWTSADLWVDFTTQRAQTRPLYLGVSIDPGGFPRTQVDSLRIDFGDGYSGYSEGASHEYDAPGIYLVQVELRLVGHIIRRATQTVVMGDLNTEPRLSMTLNDIPEFLNGSIDYRDTQGTGDPDDDTFEPFGLLVPNHGFHVDVTVFEDPEAPIDLEALSLTADVAVGEHAAGDDLSQYLVWAEAPQQQARIARWAVDSNQSFPTGLVTLTLSTPGDSPQASVLTFETQALTPALDPFDRAMTWVFLFDVDNFSVVAESYDGGAMGLIATAGANGIADFDEDLTGIGAMSNDTAAGAATVAGRAGEVGASRVFRRWVIDAITKEAYRYYEIAPDGTPVDGASFVIVDDDATTAPSADTFSPEGEASFMRFGGIFNDGALGYSGFGAHNEDRVDDSALGRGVATTAIMNPVIGTPGLTAAFDSIKPSTGTPVGEHPLDGTVLAAEFDPWDLTHPAETIARYADLTGVARALGLVIGSVTAHEMGHAMGLVPNGPPPEGFFGGNTTVEFMSSANTNSHHADYPGLNLMQAGGNIIDVLFGTLEKMEVPLDASLPELAVFFALENRLSHYSRAYIHGRLIYSNFNGGDAGLIGCWAPFHSVQP